MMQKGAEKNATLEGETLTQNADLQRERDKERSELTQLFGGKYFLNLKDVLPAPKRDGYGLPSPTSPNSHLYNMLTPRSKVEEKYQFHGQSLPDDWRDKYNVEQARGKLRVIAYHNTRRRPRTKLNEIEFSSQNAEPNKKSTLGL